MTKGQYNSILVGMTAIFLVLADSDSAIWSLFLAFLFSFTMIISKEITDRWVNK